MPGCLSTPSEKRSTARDLVWSKSRGNICQVVILALLSLVGFCTQIALALVNPKFQKNLSKINLFILGLL